LLQQQWANAKSNTTRLWGLLDSPTSRVTQEQRSLPLSAAAKLAASPAAKQRNWQWHWLQKAGNSCKTALSGCNTASAMAAKAGSGCKTALATAGPHV